jgi:hypothetical protein
MKKDIKDRIIEALLTVIDQQFAESGYKDMMLFPEIRNENDVNVYTLIVRGERDKDNVFYSGSDSTHISEENYCGGELVYASIINQSKIRGN